jgi:hypothetical protein
MIGARLVAEIEDTGLGMVFGSPDIDVGPTTVRPDAAVVLNEHADIVAEKRLSCRFVLGKRCACR